jgi:hypothetical protein
LETHDTNATKAISLISQITTAIALIVSFAIRLDPDWLFKTSTNGLGGLLCGLVVAYKQAIPEHSIQLFKTRVCRVKHLPSLIFLIHLVGLLVGVIYKTFFLHCSGIVGTIEMYLMARRVDLPEVLQG